MPRQPKPRTRTTPAKGKYPRQTLGGYYPATWRIVPAKERHKNVTVEEALAAYRAEPAPDDSLQRIYIYGHHTPYRAGEVDKGELDVLAASDVRGDVIDALKKIQADRDAYRAQLEVDEFARMGKKYPKGIPKDVARLLRRRITTSVNEYEQGLFVEFANVEIASAAPWKRVVGIWVAS